MKKRVLATLLATALTAGGALAAPLMGSTVSYQYYYPTLDSPYAGTPNVNGNYVVGEGDEIRSLTDAVGWMDISANQILVQFSHGSRFGAADFSGWVLSDVFGTIDSFMSVSIDPSTTLAGMTSERLSFTADSISVNWGGLIFQAGDRLVLNVLTRGAIAVPEPGTLSLMGVALLGIAAVRRRG
ncbi:PEP-CTERM sorting domain-containing protein [Azohydromonas caseinilytica]|uniref:PEP-CTERM sorting domain-containing protein n=1 Tax=Azohydromonas caseinilytica TaxID=2728836 RepID=A0A848FAP6_9BURK|nr:PEP-CTERM sorting domain-containing protein [Azohydromonas caseinilytica]NML15041.1 PEP-CTERM sorting domain-containing protein [Azohydromonas caseinilytica]